MKKNLDIFLSRVWYFLNWNNLATELHDKYNLNAHIVIPESLTDKVLKWYHKIDEAAFRKELRYSDEELRERWNKENKQMIFLLDDDGPIAVHLGYDLEHDSDTYYVDTLATTVEGKGIGSVLTNYIKEYAKEEDYSELQLDTEATNERGVPLRHFYEKNGFKLTESNEDGNITMKYKIK